MTDKTPEEIVFLMRNDYAPDIHVMDDMKFAADLIESLQARLSASQLREQAAVEDLESLMRESKEFCACTY